MEAIRYIQKDIEVEITNITLLTIEEVRALPPDIRCYCGWWWLRSPGCTSACAAVCCAVGTVDYYGYEVNYFNGTVRPALTLSNLDSEPLEIGEEISIAGKNYIAIGKDRVLYNDKLFLHRFDKKSNEYEKSEIKKIVDKWLNRRKNNGRVYIERNVQTT